MIWPADRIARLQALKRQGLSHSQIGARMGLTEDQVHGKVYRLAHPKVKTKPRCGEWDAKLFEPWSERQQRMRGA